MQLCKKCKLCFANALEGIDGSAFLVGGKYDTNGLTVRYQRTRSTLPTDWQSVPKRTEVNPL
jgi:hypothetical protein